MRGPVKDAEYELVRGVGGLVCIIVSGVMKFWPSGDAGHDGIDPHQTVLGLRVNYQL